MTTETRIHRESEMGFLHILNIIILNVISILIIIVFAGFEPPAFYGT